MEVYPLHPWTLSLDVKLFICWAPWYWWCSVILFFSFALGKVQAKEKVFETAKGTTSIISIMIKILGIANLIRVLDSSTKIYKPLLWRQVMDVISHGNWTFLNDDLPFFPLLKIREISSLVYFANHLTQANYIWEGGFQFLAWQVFPSFHFLNMIWHGANRNFM